MRLYERAQSHATRPEVPHPLNTNTFFSPLTMLFKSRSWVMDLRLSKPVVVARTIRAVVQCHAHAQNAKSVCVYAVWELLRVQVIGSVNRSKVK